MTPKPDNLPAPADMELATLLREMARVLHNAGGAGYSAELADAAIARADNLPGWRPIETAKSGQANPAIVAVPTEQPNEFIVGEAYCDLKNGDWWWAGTFDSEWGDSPIIDTNHGAPVKWYDFGNGAPLPPPPQAPEAAKEADHG